jgi:DegV family protein with EDD domain
MSVAIVTDSTACIPLDLVERYGIEVVPVNIVFGGRTFNDAMREDTSAFYELLRRSGERPTTAAPSPGRYVEAIGRAARRADSVLCITVSRQFSAMFDSARQAVSMIKSESAALDVRLLDSRNAAMAQGFVVIEAARAAESGATPDAVVQRADAIAAQVRLIAVLETLTYLSRSGRVPRVVTWAAGMLHVRPIVRFHAGGVALAGRARSRPRAIAELAHYVEAACGRRPAHIAVHHADAPGDAAMLASRLSANLHIVETCMTEFTQVMGVHTGPGLLGVAFWVE